MPNRILKETVCTSENIDILSPEAERFFYRLMIQCDDFGRMDARLSVLRARCFPLKLDIVRDDNISEWLTELETAGLITLYNGDDCRPYLYFLTWEKHQQIRAKKSKFPPPPVIESDKKNLISHDINGNHLLANVPENPIQSKENTTPQAENIFVVFENEIGPLTVNISNELIEAEERYTTAWVVDAIKAASSSGKRSLNYVKGILRNWKAEGREPPKNGKKPRSSEKVEIELPGGEKVEASL